MGVYTSVDIMLLVRHNNLLLLWVTACWKLGVGGVMEKLRRGGKAEEEWRG